ncbi:hypothetical protein J7E25_01280 [Agromyces sp. ISL-38]|uniref:hypothetical protein n=1 Tax=Agromyces sp. ISL-38 TaxID=2819107 RepID=UPI001BE7478B|nr:hypothetical protein [Agromyces sp. ISL-38]MBT2497720.1 hypothetical protein [Agromyces sp. ISL-38]MBT2517196.1 hypothetical protein [Streptomyces sp. ISL-90]
MDDSLTVSGGGSTAVATDELFVDAARLGAVETVMTEWSERASVIWRGLVHLDLDEPLVTWGVAPGRQVQETIGRLAEAGEQAGRLRVSLIESAERYGATERMIDALWAAGGRLGGWTLGWFAPAIVGAGLAAAAAQGMVRLFGIGQTPTEAWLAEHRELLSDPAFVRVVRAAADSADEFTAGLLHLPSTTAPIGTMIGAPENASVLLALAGGLGLAGGRLLVDGPVQVSRVGVGSSSPGAAGDGRAGPPDPGRSVPAPSGVGDLAERVPASGDAQIRIERYGPPGDARWIVYISGTIEVGLDAGEQPFDMTSNVHGIADDSALDDLRFAGADSGAGERAVRQAMADAGVAPGEPLLAVGHSGGGIIAASLAGDPELNTVGVLNLGGPVASAELREGVQLLSIEHEEDLVPASGGAGHPSDQRTTVSRSVLDPSVEYSSMLPAHELSRYRETAALVDESEEERLSAFRTLVADVTGDGEGRSTEWKARRDLSCSTTTTAAR